MEPRLSGSEGDAGSNQVKVRGQRSEVNPIENCRSQIAEVKSLQNALGLLVLVSMFRQQSSVWIQFSTVERPFVVTIALLAAAVLTFMALVREALPHLSSEDRASLQSLLGPPTFSRLRVSDNALGRAWEVHGRVFPQSRKRILFAALLVATALSVFAYPLWTATK